MDMIDTLIQASGGLGLFLIGMVVMTDGLRKLAGDSMRNALMRFTHSPASGATTGAVATAILQSSSAMTVAAVGFVSAGLLTFAEALGIVFGANIGTTITGWLVALLGFKLKLGSVVLPLILVGALLRLFGHGKLSASGQALAGFGLIFVGIGMMQTGMAGLHSVITPETLPADSWTGRLLLVGIGIVITVITQSSSAGVATAITAIHVGAINFNQAAALVIGMDIGTTATALLATVGGSLEARRTGLSHVIYNLMTGSAALLLITPYVVSMQWLLPGQIDNNPELVLVGFHTTFNLLGVFIVLPFAGHFAHMIERLMPGSGPAYTRQLPRELLAQPKLALNAVQHSVQQIYHAALQHIAAMLRPQAEQDRAELPALLGYLRNAHDYLDSIRFAREREPVWDRAIALLHAIDHLLRLLERCEEEEDRVIVARTSAELEPLCQQLYVTTTGIARQMQARDYVAAVEAATQCAALQRQHYDALRQQIFSKIPAAEIDVNAATDRLEAVRWLKRCSAHIEDISAYLQQAINATGETTRSRRDCR